MTTTLGRETSPNLTPLIAAMLLIGLFLLIYTPFLQPVPDGDFYMPAALKSHVIPVPLVSALMGITLLLGSALLALLKRQHMIALIIIIATGVILRIIMGFTYLGSFDVNYFFFWPEMIGKGEPLYGGIFDPKGPPLQAYAVYAGALLGDVIKLPIYGIVAVFSTIADVVTTVLIYRIAKREGQPESVWLLACALFILNPITVLITGAHKHLGTSVYIATTVAAYALIKFDQRHRWAGLVFGLGIAFRQLPILYIPAFLAHCKTWRARLEFFVLAGLPSLLLLLPYLVKDPGQMIKSISGYSGVGRWWGTAMLMEEISNHIFHGYGNEEIAFVERTGGTVLLIILAVLGVVLFPKISLLQSLIITTHIFYLNPMGFSTHYPFILVAFLVLDFSSNSIYWYTLLGGIFTFMAYMAAFYPPLDRPIEYIQWVTVVVAGWCLVDLIQRLRESRAPESAVASPTG